MPNDDFVHLHVHSEFSMLDGAARISEVMDAVAADGGRAVGLTDHGVLYGVVDFYRAARDRNLTPVLGVEAYLTAGSRFDRPPPQSNTRYHITLLAENQTGYANLLKLVSRAYLEGFYYKPRLDLELLAEYAAGLIATTGCLGGQIPQLLAPDASREEGNTGGVRDTEAALRAAGVYQDIFGKDNFFIELQDHGLEPQRRIMPDLMDISRRLGAPLLATNDIHYTRPDQAQAHDALLCIQTASIIAEETRLKFDSQEFYLKTARQMRDLFPQDQYPGACDNTLLVAERSDVRIDFDQILLPHFQVPDGHTSVSYLRQLVLEGARARYPVLEGETAERIEHELKIIEEMGFPDYFLIVWDLVRHAREQGIRVGPGRGSAAGSIVAYALRITDLDPMHYGLIFERFLNPGRREMPDIDIDFDERHRGRVLQYLVDKYGSDHVAQIVTFSTIKGKQAIRDSARVLGFSYETGDRLAKMMPQAVLGREASLDICFNPPAEDAESLVKDWHANAAGLREAYREQEDAKQVIDTARGLEHLRRQDSIHAAAVVISPEPLTELVPLQRKGDDKEVVTQYEMGAIESLGLLKMDILGLRTLSTIDKCLDLVESTQGHRPDIDNVDLRERKTFEMMCRGDTVGVFQLEGSAMRVLIRSLQPDRFEDVIALVALYRPGPMSNDWHNAYADRKNRRRPVEYPHPAAEEALRDTYGLMIYQEQVMEIARQIAGYSMADADSLRKAMGKKIPSIMKAEREKFIAGAQAQGHPPQLGGSLFDSIEGFAGYGFNKSHSAAYGLLAYQTAYLKANYPPEYMAALLTSVRKDKDKTALYLSECRAMGLEVICPSVNHAQSDYAVVGEQIMFGMAAVRNVGPRVVDFIVEAREGEEGPFTDFPDFLNRVRLHVLNKGTVGALIKAGAFDTLGHTRKGLYEVMDTMVDVTLARRRNEDRGQYGLFGEEDAGVDVKKVKISKDEWRQSVRLGFEKEMLGMYVSDHPLHGAGRRALNQADCSIVELWDREDGERVKVAGIVGKITRRYTRNGDLMIFFELEDTVSAVEVLAFPRTVESYGDQIEEDAIVLVEARLNHSEDEVKLRAYEVRQPTIRTNEDYSVRVVAEALVPEAVLQLKRILANHRGQVPVLLHMTAHNGSESRVLRLDDEFSIEPSSTLDGEIAELFGAESLAAPGAGR